MTGYDMMRCCLDSMCANKKGIVDEIAIEVAESLIDDCNKKHDIDQNPSVLSILTLCEFWTLINDVLKRSEDILHDSFMYTIKNLGREE